MGSCLIGLDGGGTKTLLKIADPDGKLKAVCQGGPSNLYGGTLSDIRENIRELLATGMRQAGISHDDVAALCLGAAGAGREREKGIYREMLQTMDLSCPILVTDDLWTALYGGFGKGEGILLISGTGAVCFGRNPGGETHRAGGWGYLIGDEGSGYAVGQQILMHVMKAFDGRGSSTLLTDLLLNRWEIASPEECIRKVYTANNVKETIAASAIVLDEGCRAGDAAALAIAREAAEELFLCADAVIKRLNSTGETLGIILQGSILTKGSSVKDALLKKLTAAYPCITVGKPLEDAAWGAVLMAGELVSRQ